MSITRANARRALVENRIFSGDDERLRCLDSRIMCASNDISAKVGKLTSYIMAATEYSINNGFKKFGGQITELCETASGFLKRSYLSDKGEQRRTDKRYLKCAKIEEEIVRSTGELSLIRVGSEAVVTTGNGYKTGISRAVKECMRSIREAVGVYREELCALKKNCDEFFKKLDGELNKAEQQISDVADDSSANALEYAEQIVDKLCDLRTNLVYSQLDFGERLLAPLYEVNELAERWHNNVAGVGGVSRAGEGDVDRLCAMYCNDQLAEYLRASAR